MEDLITDVGIDAKHSNEDQIAPFPEWVRRYGDRIGNSEVLMWIRFASRGRRSCGNISGMC